jgi:hypothetical protein
MGAMTNASASNDLKEIEQQMAEVEVLTEDEARAMANAFKNNMTYKSSKMQGIFTKAQSNYNSVVETLSSSAVPGDEEVDESKKTKEEDSEKQMTMMLSPLQVIIAKLKMDIELAHSKARSSEIQR